jgi:hypothetical protein
VRRVVADLVTVQQSHMMWILYEWRCLK